MKESLADRYIPNVFRTMILMALLSGAWVVPGMDRHPDLEEVREKTHNRQYPGGIDEEDLQVQADLPVPEQKVNAKAVQGEVLKVKIAPEDDSQEE